MPSDDAISAFEYYLQHPSLILSGDLPNRQTLNHEFLVVVGPFTSGKTAIRRLLLDLYGRFYVGAPKTVVRKLRKGESRKDVRCLTEREYFQRLASESSLSTCLTDLFLRLIDDPCFFSEDNNYGFSFQLLTTFFVSELEELVAEAEESGANVVIDLTPPDAAAFGMLFPNSSMFGISVDQEQIIDRHVLRGDWASAVSSDDHKLVSYHLQRFVQALLTCFNPPLMDTMTLTCLPNNTPEDLERNVVTIHETFQARLCKLK